MATKFESLFRDRPFALAFKAAVFVAALAALGGGGGLRAFPFLAFAGIAAILYRHATPHRGAPLIRTFAFIVLLSAFFIPLLGEIAPRPLWIIMFGAAFYILLGVKTLSFTDYRSYWIILNAFLLTVVFLGFFLTRDSFSPIWRWAAVLFAVFALAKDIFEIAFVREGVSGTQTAIPGPLQSIAALMFVVCSAELLWIVGFLPLTIIGSASMLIGALFMVADLFLSYFKGRLSTQRILKVSAVFAAIVLFVFFTTGLHI